MSSKLYVEFRLYFDLKTNQELLKECAEQFQHEIHSLWEDSADVDSPIPSLHDVTFEIVMEAGEKEVKNEG